jgi:hypothetical protein
MKGKVCGKRGRDGFPSTFEGKFFQCATFALDDRNSYLQTSQNKLSPSECEPVHQDDIRHAARSTESLDSD